MIAPSQKKVLAIGISGTVALRIGELKGHNRDRRTAKGDFGKGGKEQNSLQKANQMAISIRDFFKTRLKTIRAAKKSLPRSFHVYVHICIHILISKCFAYRYDCRDRHFEGLFPTFKFSGESVAIGGGTTLEVWFFDPVLPPPAVETFFTTTSCCMRSF